MTSISQSVNTQPSQDVMGSGSGKKPSNTERSLTPPKEDVENFVGYPVINLDLEEVKQHPKFCGICFEDGDHYVHKCPYRKCIPKAAGDLVGPGYDIVCTKCGKNKNDHEGELGEDWIGRAVPKSCLYCATTFDHASYECKYPVPFNILDYTWTLHSGLKFNSNPIPALTVDVDSDYYD